ncbi:MAG: hypothetical protein RLZZ196_738 [Bacteroidota bacterium]|jgi:hypothetical protein
MVIRFLLFICFLSIQSTLAHNTYENIESANLGYEVRDKLIKLYKAVGLEDEVPEAIKVLDLLTESWSEYDTKIRWVNSLGNSHPWEFSLTFKENRELPVIRFLIEPQSSPFTLQTSWNAGLKLKEKLKNIPDVDISKLDKILSIFAPITTPQTPSNCESFAIWYAAELENHTPRFKVYLNPRIHGEKKAPELIEKTLSVLDNKAAWKLLAWKLQVVNPSSKSKIAFLSLDLSTDIKARIKIYVANQLISDIEKQLQGTRYYVHGTASNWIKMLINKKDVFDVRPIVIAFNFTKEHNLPVPTIHIPIDPYVNNDEIIIQRLNKFLSPNQIKRLTEVITQISKNSLKSGSFITYVSLRPLEHGQLDVTVYLAV